MATLGTSAPRPCLWSPRETPPEKPNFGLVAVAPGKRCVVRDCGYSKPPPSAQSRRNRLIWKLLPPDRYKLIMSHRWQPSRSVIARSLLWPVNEDRFQELTATLRLRLPLCRAGGILFLVRAAAPAGEAIPLRLDGQGQAQVVVGTENPPGDLSRVRNRFAW